MIICRVTYRTKSLLLLGYAILKNTSPLPKYTTLICIYMFGIIHIIVLLLQNLLLATQDKKRYYILSSMVQEWSDFQQNEDKTQTLLSHQVLHLYVDNTDDLEFVDHLHMYENIRRIQ